MKIKEKCMKICILLGIVLLIPLGNVEANSKLETVSTPPKVIKTIPVVYPTEAIVEEGEGKTVLQITVSRTGYAINPRVLLSSGNEYLDNAAIRSISEWEFEPATVNGMPVAVEVQIPFTFELTDEVEEDREEKI